MTAGSVFPPIVVFHDGATYWLADGYHRLEATDEAGLKEIAAEIREGTRREAIEHACGANQDHGLRRSRADVRRAITTLVEDAEWGELANRAIAEMVGCDHKTVAAVRDELVRWGNSPTEDSDQDAPTPNRQVGKFPNCEPAPVIEELEGDDLAGIRQATARMKGEAAPPPAKRKGRDGKNYPASKAKPAPTPVPKPAPAVNKTRLAMQAALGVAAALTVLEPLEGDLLREDAETVMSNLRAALARLEARFGGEVLGHA